MTELFVLFLFIGFVVGFCFVGMFRLNSRFRNLHYRIQSLECAVDELASKTLTPLQHRKVVPWQ